MVLEGHAPRVHSSKYSRRPGWGWLFHDSGAISASWKIQGPQAGNGSVGGPAEPLKKKKERKKACSWLCRPKCLYEVRHLSRDWTLSHVNSLHPHTHSRRLGYFSCYEWEKKTNSRSAASHSWPSTLYTEKWKTQTHTSSSLSFLQTESPLKSSVSAWKYPLDWTSEYLVPAPHPRSSWRWGWWKGSCSGNSWL